MTSESGGFDDVRDGKRKRSDKDLINQDNKKRKANNICRDFLRNVCERGAYCKFTHPDSHDRTFAFCHDFQNGYCHRGVNCRFIHSSYKDEQAYLMTRQLPSHLQNWYEKPRRISPDNEALPCCKRFFNGECWVDDCGHDHVTPNEHRIREGRSPSPILRPQEDVFESDNNPYCKAHFLEGCLNYKCRLRHFSRNEYRMIDGLSSAPQILQRHDNNMLDQRPVNDFQSRNKYRDNYFEPQTERPFISDKDRIRNSSSFENTISYQSNNQPNRSSIILEEENIMLRERIRELKKRIDELQITNEFLLEQNARLRIQQDKNAAGLTVPAMTVGPAVTINSVPTASQIQQSPTPQQMVTATLRTVTANVATVPVSISTVTPVSLSAVSMAPVQQIAGSVMTIAQQSAPPTEPQIAPQPLPISISAPSVPLVSYPIVSRTVMQPSAPQPPPPMRH